MDWCSRQVLQSRGGHTHWSWCFNSCKLSRLALFELSECSAYCAAGIFFASGHFGYKHALPKLNVYIVRWLRTRMIVNDLTEIAATVWCTTGYIFANIWTPLSSPIDSGLCVASYKGIASAKAARSLELVCSTVSCEVRWCNTRSSLSDWPVPTFMF